MELRDAASNIGLKVALGRDKSLLIPCAGSFRPDRVNFPSDLEVQTDGNFEFLGCPIGTPEHCRAHTAKRVGKACELLRAIGELPDPAVALILLRHCASFGKLVYSARVVPHTFHATTMASFDEAVRDCLESFLCTSIAADDWKLASLSTKSCGLGLRHTSVHCSAAFLASGQNTRTLCRKLDPAYTQQLDNPTSPASLATAGFNSLVTPEDQLEPIPDGHSQRELSCRVDSKALQDMRATAALGDSARRAHLEVTGAPRAGTWLHTKPSINTGGYMDPLLFQTSILRWLQMSIFEEDGVCRLCDGVLDKYGDHCLVCPCGGDRTKRHNLLRNCVFHTAVSAGLNPELEKPGLLQPRPALGGAPENGNVLPPSSNARRPADVFLPRWRRGTPIALDFAVTSGLRDIPASIRDASSALTSYEDFKRSHLDTDALCNAEGFTFCPMVVEAVGGAWGLAATKVFNELAKTKSIITGEPVDSLVAQLYQNLGTILHRENARSIVKRMCTSKRTPDTILAAATSPQNRADDADGA